MNLMQQSVFGDRYTLVEPLGDGGMAKVYLARDKSLGREVALKVLREQYTGDEEFVERFRREAMSAAALNHPGIVQVYDRGRAADGAFYIAMEYVPGGTLKERIMARGKLAPPEAAEIASQVADALALAHDRGIVHRDIKPQNVLLTASGEAKVSDFGIARAASTQTMTQTNSVLGTLAYMSPEQLRGERVGPESDLYSLGVVIYEMLTGELPYQGSDPIATAMKHLDEPPRNPREVNPAVPEELGALVVRLLAKGPEDRYRSAASLSEDLRRVRDGTLPVAAGPGNGAIGRTSGDTRPTRPAPAARGTASGQPTNFGRRRTLIVPLVALLLGVALLAGLGWALGRDTPSQAPQNGGVAESVEVPGVVGLTQDEAQKRLENEGLELGGRDEAPSDTVAEGAVSEQDPAAGSRVGRGRAVDMVISTGPTQEPAPQTSPSATATASPAATSPSATAAATASPVAGEEAQKRREEARKEVQERREEAREKAQERREEHKEKGRD
jgi:eukaryotic-like serine/threonine-protein kinase